MSRKEFCFTEEIDFFLITIVIFRDKSFSTMMHPTDLEERKSKVEEAKLNLQKSGAYDIMRKVLRNILDERPARPAMDRSAIAPGAGMAPTSIEPLTSSL